MIADRLAARVLVVSRSVGALKTMVVLKRSRLSFLIGCALALSFTGWVPQAQAQDDEDDVQACAQAYEQAQVNRNEGKLRDAQEQLRACVRDACPDFIKSDCGQWLSEVAAEIPSVILAARDGEGKDLIDVKVSTNEQVLTESLDGRAIELDPGQYTLVFEHEGQKVETNLVVSQGEKNRVVRVKFEAPVVDTDGDGIPDAEDKCPNEAGVIDNDGCPPKAAPIPADAGMNPLLIGAYAGWGVGVVGVAGFTIFGLQGKGLEDDAIAECGADSGMPPCGNDREDELQQRVDDKFLLANISLGVGVAGAAAGTVLFFLAQDEKPESAATEEELTFDVRPITGGSFFSVQGSF